MIAVGEFFCRECEIIIVCRCGSLLLEHCSSVRTSWCAGYEVVLVIHFKLSSKILTECYNLNTPPQNVSPCHLNYEDTANTLKYASRAKMIKTRIQKNASRVVSYDVAQYANIIQDLRSEISELKMSITTQPGVPKTEKRFEGVPSLKTGGAPLPSVPEQTTTTWRADADNEGTAHFSEAITVWERTACANIEERVQLKRSLLDLKHSDARCFVEKSRLQVQISSFERSSEEGGLSSGTERDMELGEKPRKIIEWQRSLGVMMVQVEKHVEIRTELNARLAENNREAEELERQLDSGGLVESNELRQFFRLMYKIQVTEVSNMELEEVNQMADLMISQKDLEMEKLRLQIALRDRIIAENADLLAWKFSGSSGGASASSPPMVGSPVVGPAGLVREVQLSPKFGCDGAGAGRKSGSDVDGFLCGGGEDNNSGTMVIGSSQEQDLVNAAEQQPVADLVRERTTTSDRVLSSVGGLLSSSREGPRGPPAFVLEKPAGWEEITYVGNFYSPRFAEPFMPASSSTAVRSPRGSRVLYQGRQGEDQQAHPPPAHREGYEDVVRMARAEIMFGEDPRDRSRGRRGSDEGSIRGRAGSQEQRGREGSTGRGQQQDGVTRGREHRAASSSILDAGGGTGILVQSNSASPDKSTRRSSNKVAHFSHGPPPGGGEVQTTSSPSGRAARGAAAEYRPKKERSRSRGVSLPPTDCDDSITPRDRRSPTHHQHRSRSEPEERRGEIPAHGRDDHRSRRRADRGAAPERVDRALGRLGADRKRHYLPYIGSNAAALEQQRQKRNKTNKDRGSALLRCNKVKLCPWKEFHDSCE